MDKAAAGKKQGEEREEAGEEGEPVGRRWERVEG